MCTEFQQVVCTTLLLLLLWHSQSQCARDVLLCYQGSCVITLVINITATLIDTVDETRHDDLIKL